MRVDADLAQQRRKEKCFVFAIAPALIEHVRWLMRLVRVAAHLDAEIADVVLDETDGGDNLRVASRVLVADLLRKFFYFDARCVIELEERVRPFRDLAPRRELADLYVIVRIEPIGRVVFDVDRSDVAALPRED